MNALFPFLPNHRRLTNHLHKQLGHYGLCVQNFPAQVSFYTQTFNIVPTDFLWVPSNNPNDNNKTNGPQDSSPRKDVAIFAHIDRGAAFVDHHCFFLSTNKTQHVHHASFEVHDFDTQSLGHQWLERKGYELVWGVGRHLLGSQIFDYWWDPTGERFLFFGFWRGLF